MPGVPIPGTPGADAVAHNAAVHLHEPDPLSPAV
jgi:hypothetical protein